MFKYYMENNIKPCFWGKNVWNTINNVISVYPENPTNDDIEAIKYFFLSLKNLLPCESCRISYSNFITLPETDVSNINNLNSRDNLIYFVFKLRNLVNNKIGLDYGITFIYFKLKLNNMICKNNNKLDFYFTHCTECPIISNDLQKKIIKYVHKNKKYINNYDEENIEKLVISLKNFLSNPDIKQNKLFELFKERNKKCYEIILKIYSNMASGDYDYEKSFKEDKELHIKLFYLCCSIIPYEILKKLI